MSRKNNLKRRRDQHAAALLDERVRLAEQEKRRDRRRIKKEKKSADAELSVALGKLATVEEGEAKAVVPKVGAPLTVSDDVDKRMRVASRIRKRAPRKKAAVRSAKIRARMLARQENLMANMGDK